VVGASEEGPAEPPPAPAGGLDLRALLRGRFQG
jgi:hypothetical protein